MKNLILENDNTLDERISDFLEDQPSFNESKEEWLKFRFAFWPEERANTIKKFLSLENGDNIICQTVFDGMDQAELMINVLHKLMNNDIKINFYIICNCMIEDFKKYVNSYPYVDEKEEEERQRILKEMKNVILYHNIYNLKGSLFHDLNNRNCILLTPELLGYK